MTLVTPKTNFIDLLDDLLDFVNNNIGLVGALSLHTRIEIALDELEEDIDHVT